jgi:hypothetical protein
MGGSRRQQERKDKGRHHRQADLVGHEHQLVAAGLGQGVPRGVAERSQQHEHENAGIEGHGRAPRRGRPAGLAGGSRGGRD